MENIDGKQGTKAKTKLTASRQLLCSVQSVLGQVGGQVGGQRFPVLNDWDDYVGPGRLRLGFVLDHMTRHDERCVLLNVRQVDRLGRQVHLEEADLEVEAFRDREGNGRVPRLSVSNREGAVLAQRYVERVMAAVIRHGTGSCTAHFVQIYQTGTGLGDDSQILRSAWLKWKRFAYRSPPLLLTTRMPYGVLSSSPGYCT